MKKATMTISITAEAGSKELKLFQEMLERLPKGTTTGETDGDDDSDEDEKPARRRSETKASAKTGSRKPKAQNDEEDFGDDESGDEDAEESDDDGDNEGEEDEDTDSEADEDDSEEDEEEPAPKKRGRPPGSGKKASSAKGPTLEKDIIPAFQAYAKKNSRAEALKLLKSKFKVGNVSELDEAKYPAVLKALKVA